ncbi:MAG: DUF3784 domain-containing protein [Thermoguttaceae bacterium]|nr:DUF3784 domain-containing protein [Thermoguttaceae bacterium]
MSLRLNLTSLKIDDRITPSDRRSGVWIEAALAFGFLICGIIGVIVIFFCSIMPQWRLFKEYQKTQCTVIETAVVNQGNSDLYRPQIHIKYVAPTPIHSDNSGKTILKQYSIWTYDFNTLNNSGYFYQKDEAYNALKAFETNKQYDCWYDPHYPQKVVVLCNWSWTNVTMLIVPISLFLLGLGSLIHIFMYQTVHSQKKTAIPSGSLQNKPSDNADELSSQIASDSESVPEQAHVLPNVPSVQNIIDSPGVKMKYRLPLANSPIGSLGVLLLLCIGWGLLCIAILSVGIGGFLDKNPDWILIGFTVVFFLIGIGLVLYFIHNLQLATSVSPTLLETNDTPLHPGQTTTALLIQMGGNYFFKLSVVLVCEEEAFFSYGTDIRSEKFVAYETTLFSEKDFNIVTDEQFEKSFEFTIPPNAMHSFDSLHNRISWRLDVCGEAEGAPPFTRSYVLVVNP